MVAGFANAVPSDGTEVDGLLRFVWSGMSHFVPAEVLKRYWFRLRSLFVGHVIILFSAKLNFRPKTFSSRVSIRVLPLSEVASNLGFQRGPVDRESRF